MNIISLNGISKSYSDKQLLNNIFLGISDSDKIGLIGMNGSGKTTLLKIISGIESAENGSIVKKNKCKIEYLSQNPVFEKDTSVLQHVFSGNSAKMKLLREYEECINSNYEEKSYNLLEITQRMDELGVWNSESEAKTILTKLKISNFHDNVSNLSGGQRKRVAIACALIHECDLLILDEPTNHIDNDMVDWLERYLSNRKGALLMVTHDRYFLDRIVNKIVEIDKANLYIYQANYSKYLELKLQRDELEEASIKKKENLYRRELEWIKRGARARSTKQKARIERFEDLKNNIVRNVKENVEIGAKSRRLGKKVIKVENISKSFGKNVLIKDFTYIFSKDDKIGIVGNNGIGKSTFLKIIAGELKSDKGDIEIGETVKIGFFSQENDEMNENLRIIEYIKEVAEFIKTNEGEISASKMLEKFLFTPKMQWNLISKLSGGEKRRLYLLKVLMTAPNVLILDEPTNDLDIATLNILENYLESFKGVVITVSHDRYFLDKCVDRIFSFEGKAVINQYMGNYSDYYDEIRKKISLNINDKKNNENLNREKNKRDKTLKFTYKEKIEFEKIDEAIENLENEIKKIDVLISKNSSNFEKLQELIEKKDSFNRELENVMDRWVYLNELYDKINSK